MHDGPHLSGGELAESGWAIVVEQLIVLPLGVGHEQIEPAIIIVIRPGNRPGHAQIVDNGAVGDFGKGSITLIMEEEVLEAGEIGDVLTVGHHHVYKTIVIEVPPGQAAGKVVIANDGANRGRV